jgi:hypothetical protein
MYTILFLAPLDKLWIADATRRYQKVSDPRHRLQVGGDINVVHHQFLNGGWDHSSTESNNIPLFCPQI